MVMWRTRQKTNASRYDKNKEYYTRLEEEDIPGREDQEAFLKITHQYSKATLNINII